MATLGHAIVLAVAIIVLTGCASVVTGSGDNRVSPSGPSSSSRGTPSPSVSTPSPAVSKFPRTPASTAIGDPVTADLCAVAPLSAFEDFGYSPAYQDSALPPGCVINMRKAGQVAFTVYAYGVGSSSFSHLTPLSPAQAKPIGTKTVDGIDIAQYKYLPKVSGTCVRNVLAQGLTVSVFSYTQQGQPDEKANCGAADAMAALMARAAAATSVPRLQLAQPTVSDLDFCAVLRATKLSDLNGYTGGAIAPDGVGDGCQIMRDRNSFTLYVDFVIRNDRQPLQSETVTEGGHVLYSTQYSDDDQCKFTSTQGTTPGGYEAVAVYVADSSGRAPSDLCESAATLTARFLDVAGLT